MERTAISLHLCSQNIHCVVEFGEYEARYTIPPVCYVLQFIHHHGSFQLEKVVGCYLSKIFECDLLSSFYRRIIFACYIVKVVLFLETPYFMYPPPCTSVPSRVCRPQWHLRAIYCLDLPVNLNSNNNTQDRLRKSVGVRG